MQKQSSDPIRMNRTDIHIVIAPNDLCYAESITRFQVDMAMESEGLALDFSRTLKGVESVLQDESKGRYVLAVINDTPVGSLMLLVNGAIGTAVGIYGSKACMYHQLTAGMAFTRPCMTKS